MKYFILILALITAGCGHSNPVLVTPMHVDSAIIQPCQPLEKSEVRTVDDVLRENISLYEKYAICSRKQDDSIKLIKKLANTQ